MYSRKKNKKENTHINCITNCRKEMKHISINMDYCLFQFDALKFFLLVRLHGESLPNFDFFNVNSTFNNKIVKFITEIVLTQIFATFLTLF